MLVWILPSDWRRHGCQSRMIPDQHLLSADSGRQGPAIRAKRHGRSGAVEITIAAALDSRFDFPNLDAAPITADHEALIGTDRQNRDPIRFISRKRTHLLHLFDVP